MAMITYMYIFLILGFVFLFLSVVALYLFRKDTITTGEISQIGPTIYRDLSSYIKEERVKIVNFCVYMGASLTLIGVIFAVILSANRM